MATSYQEATEEQAFLAKRRKDGGMFKTEATKSFSGNTTAIQSESQIDAQPDVPRPPPKTIIPSLSDFTQALGGGRQKTSVYAPLNSTLFETDYEDIIARQTGIMDRQGKIDLYGGDEKCIAHDEYSIRDQLYDTASPDSEYNEIRFYFMRAGSDTMTAQADKRKQHVMREDDYADLERLKHGEKVLGRNTELEHTSCLECFIFNGPQLLGNVFTHVEVTYVNVLLHSNPKGTEELGHDEPVKVDVTFTATINEGTGFTLVKYKNHETDRSYSDVWVIKVSKLLFYRSYVCMHQLVRNFGKETRYNLTSFLAIPFARCGLTSQNPFVMTCGRVALLILKSLRFGGARLRKLMSSDRDCVPDEVYALLNLFSVIRPVATRTKSFVQSLYKKSTCSSFSPPVMTAPLDISFDNTRNRLPDCTRETTTVANKETFRTHLRNVEKVYVEKTKKRTEHKKTSSVASRALDETPRPILTQVSEHNPEELVVAFGADAFGLFDCYFERNVPLSHRKVLPLTDEMPQLVNSSCTTLISTPIPHPGGILYEDSDPENETFETAMEEEEYYSSGSRYIEPVTPLPCTSATSMYDFNCQEDEIENYSTEEEAAYRGLGKSARSIEYRRIVSEQGYTTDTLPNKSVVIEKYSPSLTKTRVIGQETSSSEDVVAPNSVTKHISEYVRKTLPMNPNTNADFKVHLRKRSPLFSFSIATEYTVSTAVVAITHRFTQHTQALLAKTPLHGSHMQKTEI